MTKLETEILKTLQRMLFKSWQKYPSKSHWWRLISMSFVLISIVGCSGHEEASKISLVMPEKNGFLWSPYLEWSIKNSNYNGNPFDLIAEVQFNHKESNETRKTEMFYDGDDTWKFRFTGTRLGKWQFSSSSIDGNLNNISGEIIVLPNQGNKRGFVTSSGNKWTRSADIDDRAFIPQYIMYSDPHLFYENHKKIDEDIETFIKEHGFSGFHVGVYCRWFDMKGTFFKNHRPKCKNSYKNPDIRTFEALETLILKTYNAGGVIHLWAWGDDLREHNANFLEGGINGKVDQRLQRYIAARLGPIPGWSLGYGFDLWEWVTRDELNKWYEYMHSKMFWPHLLGARSDKNKLNQISEMMDYSSYEQHRPDYDVYVKTILARSNKPSFSEDRFRIYSYRPDKLSSSKHYSSDMVRRGMWHSAMAGGVANIWGNMRKTGKEYGSTSFDNLESLNTYSRFFDHRFYVSMITCSNKEKIICLKRAEKNQFIIYEENTDTITLKLVDMSGSHGAIAVDTRQPYKEIKIDELTPDQPNWLAPYVSDWAIAVGEFPERLPHQ